VIPTLDEADTIAATLESVRPAGPGGGPAGGAGDAARGDGVEVVVADGGSRDGTPARARKAGARVIASAPGRARQLNTGAGQARGETLLFLHADTRLPRLGLQLVRESLSRPGVSGGSFALQFDSPHPVLRFQAWCSQLNLSFTTFGDQALFVSARLFHKLGGFPDQPLLEDWELQNRLRKVGRFVKIREPVTTAARRFQRRGIWRQSLLNVWLFTRYQLGGDVQKLARAYGVRQSH